MLLTGIVSVASFVEHCDQIIIVSLVASHFSFISNTDLCLFFFLPWEISTHLQKGCRMTLIYNGIPSLSSQARLSLSFFLPLYICREKQQVKSLLCSHSCDLNKMNRSAVLTHLPRRQYSWREFISDTIPFELFNIHSDNISNRP